MRVTKLSPSAKVRGRWLCQMEDGALLRFTESEVAQFGLYSGMELTQELREELDRAAQKSALRDKGLDLISLRPLSRKELVEKLTARPRDREKTPADPALAEEVADRLEELGYLNDAEYARTVVRHYSAKGYGERKLRDELWRRGVPREYWEDALDGAEDPGAGIDAFIAQKLRGREPDEKDLKRLSDALARRGYRWDDIHAALRRQGFDC